MPKRIKQLSDVQVKNAKAQKKDYKLFDGGGLYLIVTHSGSELWRFKYRFDGKGKGFSLGPYPEISLADARTKREEARKQIAHGIDPARVRKAMKQAGTAETETFEVIAREWYAKFSPAWAPSYAGAVMARLKQNLFPWMGARPINEIKAPELLTALRRAEGRGALELAHKLRTVAGQVFRYAVATGRCERDCSGDLKGALPQPGEKHHAAITDPKEVAPLLRAIDGYQGGFVVKCALRLAPMFFVRPGELRNAEWAEINLDERVWNIPAEKMKMR